ncbi:DUF1554 domain-containing protein [Leptospira semungkisensis]|uniref:DUF1554 domain-containing protein n=1 Tax=Leptospira semungkisensis TaxID=2484985 RepID=A0A4R9G5W4_9LEPT|nr:DUF1554 domain-containing protein [Leptospira semungkisensis]TGK06874.1 DUF1554 domain-containing protein [Leptospira semungkisensis]
MKQKRIVLVQFWMLIIFLSFGCNKANPISLDASGSAAGVLLGIGMPEIFGTGNSIPSDLPSNDINVFYDAQNNYVNLTFSQSFESTERFTISIESYTTVLSPAIVSYNYFDLVSGDTEHTIGFALEADDDDCSDRSGDKIHARITRDSTGTSHLYSFSVKDGDYCLFETDPKYGTELNGITNMDNYCSTLARNKGLADHANYKAFIGVLSNTIANRDPGETASDSALLKNNKRYVRKNSDGIWTKVFQTDASWPSSYNFYNPIIDSGNYWTGMNSGWSVMNAGLCMNDEGTESWIPSTTSSASGAVGTSSTSFADTAYWTINACSAGAGGSALPYVCVYSP